MESIAIGAMESTVVSSNVSSRRPKNECNFPAKLHFVLEEIEKDGLNHIVSWLPHGRAFMVHDQKAFATQILPLWFRQSKYSSFQRQLNLYGFTRISSGQDKGAHYHENFLRRLPSLCQNIQRVKIKGTRKPKSSERIDPNFYAMEPVASTESAQAQTQEPNVSKQKALESEFFPLISAPASNPDLLGLARIASMDIRCDSSKLTTEKLQNTLVPPVTAGLIPQTTEQLLLLALITGALS